MILAKTDERSEIRGSTYHESMSSTNEQKWRALFRYRCPRCCEGPIYTAGMMNQRCPNCQLLFEREPGYFLGAMYISYGMATGLLVIGLGIGSLLFPELDLGWMVLICGVLFLPLAPKVTRLARVLWIYFDRWASPVDSEVEAYAEMDPRNASGTENPTTSS